jgi:hypothetical protein
MTDPAAGGVYGVFSSKSSPYLLTGLPDKLPLTNFRAGLSLRDDAATLFDPDKNIPLRLSS